MEKQGKGTVMIHRFLIATTISCLGFALHAEPGFYKAVFTGSAFDTTSDVMSNASGVVLYPEEMYASSLPERTTVAWAGYMMMSGGVTYNLDK